MPLQIIVNCLGTIVLDFVVVERVVFVVETVVPDSVVFVLFVLDILEAVAGLSVVPLSLEEEVVVVVLTSLSSEFNSEELSAVELELFSLLLVEQQDNYNNASKNGFNNSNSPWRHNMMLR